MKLRRLFPVLSIVAVAVTAACVDGVAPTSPSLRPKGSVAASTSASSQSNLAPTIKARHDSLMALRDSIRKAAKSQRDALKLQFAIEKTAWKLVKQTWKLQQKLENIVTLDLLRCEPLEYTANAEVIGPEGGTLDIGPHRLVIPAGSLQEEQLIVGTAPMGPLVQVSFGPHGLNFLRPASLTLSYEHCLAPPDFRFSVVYVDAALQILERRPSKDKKVDQQVDGQIDHFSSYMIAY